MATTQEFTGIVRALNGITTAGQTRAAIGAALRALHDAYGLLEELPSDRASAGKTELDIVRTALEAWYRQIEKVSAAAPFKNDFAAKRKLVEKAYIVIGGIEAEAGYTPQTSNLAILAQSISEAPAVFGEAVGKVAKETGKAAGAVVGGAVTGLGVSGTVTLIIALVIVAVVLTRGSIIGRAFALVGGK